ncbi:glycine zipper 2TM domain-containing protein [Phaeovulum sp. NW3]|uniref:glycine zipper 2TM domain-containing protein n=1 Tax=Phaeovulum sp. NW3 TaxID=2934933 RepID=UPI002022681D|nr:glycine zipper 2TM domain-containing protein [Phaeovulum sp. NW3]MCL7464776.1 glycine zipper 2TM domain-containing protein [Phaeovulum sp. NW3]
MTRFLFLLPALGLLAACEDPAQSALAGAATGAVVGAAVADDDDRWAGAAIGGTLGAIAGDYIGRTQDGKQCVYRDAYGREYVAACP